MSSRYSNFYNISAYSRFNLSTDESEIHVFIREYKERIKRQLAREEECGKTPFTSFAEKRLSVTDITWLQDNHDRFFQDTANEGLVKINYSSEYGFITCMTYSHDGEQVIVGHSTGIIQENNEKFLKGTPNVILYNRWLFSEMGAITALKYAPSGTHIIVGHSSGLIQMRHGVTGVVLCTLRNIQFPPKPVYAIEYSQTEERVCYAACTDGAVYRIEIPVMGMNSEEVPLYCIKADPALQSLNLQFYGSPGISSYFTPFITQRASALSLGFTADGTRMIVGYGDSSIKVYDMETQEADITYKVHKLRLQFIPRKLQRMHSGQVCALRCHNQRPFVFASGSWDKSLRIWDWRCQVGCVMTFEGVDICSDSIDLNRDHCIAGSWQPTEALTVWDLVARKRLNIIRVQNRRPDVDGEYIYACRYWRSSQYNRKGKYAIIGGSGTNCLEVINLHNRYITCSYPTNGTILAVTSYRDRIAFGGTASTFNIVKFYDPKHEHDKYEAEVEPIYDYTKAVTVFEDPDSKDSSDGDTPSERHINMTSLTKVPSSKVSRTT